MPRDPDLAAAAIDLAPFCAPSDAYRGFDAPFSFGAHTYAITGVLALRVARRAETPERDAALRPPGEEIAALFERCATAPLRRIGALSLPAAPPSPPPRETTCRECDGSGREHECPSCDCPCPECGGAGRVVATSSRPRRSVEIADVIFDADPIALIATLPALEIETAPQSRRAMAFRFAGGEGVAMPLSGVESTHLGRIEDFEEPRR